MPSYDPAILSLRRIDATNPSDKSSPVPGDWLKTRTSLIRRLQHPSNPDGWEEFVDVYGRIIHTLGLRSGLGTQDAEDATQDSLATLAEKIPTFQYDPAKGSFKSWVLTIARSKIIDTHRRRQRQPSFEAPPPHSTHETAFLERLPDTALLPPDQVMDDAWRLGILAAARDQIRRQLSPRQYQIYDLHVIQDWPVEKITEALHISPNQVYLAKHRVGEAIATQVARLARGEYEPRASRSPESV